MCSSEGAEEGKASSQHRRSHTAWKSPSALRLSQLQLILKDGLPVRNTSCGGQFYKSHQEQFVDQNHLCSCKLDLFSASGFLDCKTNTSKELKTPVFLERFVNKKCTTETFLLKPFLYNQDFLMVIDKTKDKRNLFYLFEY